MIKELLNRAKLNSKLIGIRTSFDHWEDVIIGFVKELTDEHVCIEEIDVHGVPVGDMIIDSNEIVSLDYDDKYQRKLEFLNKLNIEPLDYKQTSILKKGDKLISYFRELLDKQHITEFHFEDNHYEIGILQNFDNDFILCKNVGSNGEYEGFSCYPIDSLVGLKYKGMEQQRIKLLHEAFGD